MPVRSFLLLFALVGWSQGVALGDEAKPAAESHAESKEVDEEGWVTLFDGKSLDGWVTLEGEPVTQGWKVDDGALHCPGRVGSIYASKEYGDFDLRFEWKISKGGNAGIKYRMVHYPKGLFGQPGWLGCEYQMLDDETRKVDPENRSAAIYDLIAPNNEKELRPVGEYNEGRIVARGTKLEHWLNGKLVVEADTASDNWKERVAKSKFRVVPDFFTSPKGKIQLQDHGNKVWIRNIRIRELEPTASE
jgi:hypothetical protein